MLKSAKIAALRAARNSGVFAAVKVSQWRNQRLLILCFHGISFEDEHEWSPGLYLSQEIFRERMQILARGGYNVLRLGEALERLQNGTLPPLSVAITFDDGEYNFHALAYPILREFGLPATQYVATYYCRKQIPVFDVTAAYLIWKHRGKKLDLSGMMPGEGDVSVDDPRGLFQRLHRSVHDRSLSADEKDAVAEELARRVGADYGEIRRRRMFHLMTAEEIAEVSGDGVSIELHTHRHRTPRDRGLFSKEIEDNRRDIVEITGKAPDHFCYPCGDYAPEFFGWLRELGVRSATTCNLGFASAGNDAMELPRMLDTSALTAVEFEGWLTGVCAALPLRRSFSFHLRSS
jgi:peptidoglycan/xylan/chitin deacetylase (PgdA/CDA1 family)